MAFRVERITEIDCVRDLWNIIKFRLLSQLRYCSSMEFAKNRFLLALYESIDYRND